MYLNNYYGASQPSEWDLAQNIKPWLGTWQYPPTEDDILVQNLFVDDDTTVSTAPTTREDWPCALYVEFPDYQVGITNNTGFRPSELASRASGVNRLPLWHSGVIFIDNEGHAKYYEYGRYHDNDKGVFGVKGDGNYRTIAVPDFDYNDTLQDYVNKLAGIFTNQKTIRIDQFIGGDTEGGEQYILQQAANPNRPAYNIIVNNCTTNAKTAAMWGLEPTWIIDPIYGTQIYFEPTPHASSTFKRQE